MQAPRFIGNYKIKGQMIMLWKIPIIRIYVFFFCLSVDRIVKRINEEGQYFPIFGICLGFELLTYVAANRVAHRKPCFSNNQRLPLEFTRGKYFFQWFSIFVDKSSFLKICENVKAFIELRTTFLNVRRN